VGYTGVGDGRICVIDAQLYMLYILAVLEHGSAYSV